MRHFLLVTLVGSALTCATVFGQSQTVTGGLLQPAPMVAINPTTGLPATAPPLPKFNLDFPGGTPQELVKAIEKATGKPVNVVFAVGSESVAVPPIKVTGVTVPELFNAIGQALRYRFFSRNQPNGMDYSFGFYTDHPVTPETIWSFRYLVRDQGQQFCQYYQLDRYLQNYTVEDITTAIETGWKMLDLASPPKLRYHKETKLLIAVGNPNDLNLVSQVLSQLDAKKTDTRPPPAKN